MEDTLDLFFEEANHFVVGHNNLSLLDYYARQGFLFLNTRQVQNVLNKTYGQIRYAIFSYELDAFLIDGDYRITHKAVMDYINAEQERYEETYHYIMSRRELSGVYVAAMGYNISSAVKALITKRYPITAIDGILEKDRTYEYDDLPQGETVVRDYYDIDSLGLPDEASVGDWARILNIAPQRLIRDLKPLKSVYLISFKTFKEYLVKREFVNMNIPIKEGDSQSDEEASMQLELF